MTEVAEGARSPGATDHLAGVSERTTKAELMRRLEAATADLRALNVQRAERLRQIEERVRRTYSGRSWNGGAVMQVIVQGSEEELREAAEFMGDLEDVLPPTLQRLLVGARTLLDEGA